ncbi:unnamed protein product [Rhizoctonia solani]|uniref:Nephrocystin 3-like N-terminal domain-containing protein n=1 Tax=Rhizoctonia solani TaxID=456999 RepID=A0A8H3GIK3_9AGAM|nr:unnamed protein product [Rhizoctonia solani]
MASLPPRDPPEKCGFFDNVKSHLRRPKDSMKSSDSPTRGSGLSPSGSGFRFLSRSRSTTPNPDTRVLFTGSDERASRSSHELPAEITTGESDAIDQRQKTPENAAWRRLGNALRALEIGTKLIPSLNSALNGFIGCLDAIKTAISNREEYDQLAEGLTGMVAMLNQYAGELNSGTSNTNIGNIAQSIEDQVSGIKQQQETKQSKLGLFRQLQCQVTLRIERGVQEQLEHTSLLRGMSPVDDARYNSSYSTTIKRRACTPKTREKIHKGLQDWVVNPDSAKIYWMSGMASTGKTTIAYSLCEWLERTNRLGASFFCSRISPTCRSLDRIVPILAYQLARYSPEFLTTLCTSLKENRDAGTLNVVQQFEYLIHRPVLKAKAAIPDSVVLVIDALDECDDSYSIHMLLDVLLKFAEYLPLKFFVVSRPEYVIMDRMMARDGAARSIMHLHEIEQSIVEEDIKKYLADALSSMSPPPSPNQIETLSKRAGNLFIYAATVVRYIHPKVIAVNSSARLEAMLALEVTRTVDGHTGSKYKELDRLYTTVLDAAFNEHLDTEETDFMRRVLWAVVCAKEPMTTATIALLADLTESRVWAALQSLRSVVHITENDQLISALHASFPEYMLDKSRSKLFHCDESQSSEILTRRCFQIMKFKLRFDICNLQSSYLMDNQMKNAQDEIQKKNSDARNFVTWYAANPCSSSTPHIYISALAFCAKSNWVYQHYRKRIQGLANISITQQDDDLLAVWSATLAIYSIAISPGGDLIAAGTENGNIHVYDTHTGVIIVALQGHAADVNSVSFSPNGMLVASGSDDKTAIIWNTHTGNIATGTLRKHT